MKVSIVIPVYNVAPYLREALDSLVRACREVVRRDSLSCAEIICVDDGSTDGSGEMLEDWATVAGSATESCAVRVVHQPNAGVSAARNRGLELASGELVAFMDPDDIVEPEWLVSLVDGLENADVAWGGYVRDGVSVLPKDVGAVYEGDAARRRIWRAVFGYRLRDLWKVLLKGGLWRNCGRELGGVWCRAFRREVLEGVRFDERLRLYEDAMFLSLLAPKVRRLKIIGSAGYHYRNRPDGALTVEGATRLLENKFAMRDVRREIDPKMTHWRGTFLLAFGEVAKLAGWRAAWNYLSFGCVSC